MNGIFNQNTNIDKLKRQREEIDNLINNFNQMPQQPINNIINTQSVNSNMVEWRILNETEEVDNLYVQNKTLFINDKNMVLKGIDGSLEKWEIKKTYPIDKKDQKISELEEKIKEMEEKLNECTKPVKSTSSEYKSDGNDDEPNKSKSKKSVE